MDISASISSVVDAAFDAARSFMGGSSAGGKFVVNHDNVLAAAKIIQTQVDTFQDKVAFALSDLNVEPPGGDVVSDALAQAWNDKLIYDADSYAVRIDEYVAGLRKLVEQLIESAKGYGYNDEAIASALGRGARA